jgi:hypothetical protein
MKQGEACGDHASPFADIPVEQAHSGASMFMMPAVVAAGGSDSRRFSRRRSAYRWRFVTPWRNWVIGRLWSASTCFSTSTHGWRSALRWSSHRSCTLRFSEERRSGPSVCRISVRPPGEAVLGSQWWRTSFVRAARRSLSRRPPLRHSISGQGSEYSGAEVARSWRTTLVLACPISAAVTWVYIAPV